MGLNIKNSFNKINNKLLTLNLVTLSLFLVLNSAKSQPKPHDLNILDGTDDIENIDANHKINTVESAINLRNYYIHQSIDNFSDENAGQILFDYGNSSNSLKTFDQNTNFDLPDKLYFDITSHQLVIWNVWIKIEVPPFDYVHETFWGDVDLKINKFKFKKFIYKEDEDSFFFYIDIEYESDDSGFLNFLIKRLWITSSTIQIPFSKEWLKTFLDIYTDPSNSLKVWLGSDVHWTYDMLDEDWKLIVTAPVRVSNLWSE